MWFQSLLALLVGMRKWGWCNHFLVMNVLRFRDKMLQVKAKKYVSFLSINILLINKQGFPPSDNVFNIILMAHLMDPRSLIMWSVGLLSYFALPGKMPCCWLDCSALWFWVPITNKTPQPLIATKHQTDPPSSFKVMHTFESTIKKHSFMNFSVSTWWFITFLTNYHFCITYYFDFQKIYSDLCLMDESQLHFMLVNWNKCT